MSLALVVEDDLALGKLICHSLKRAGISTICVSTAEEASIELARNPVDFALVDVMLPGTSGLYVVEAVRQMAKEKRPAVVLITGTRTNVLDKIDRAVVKTVMFKPLNISALVAFVSALPALPREA